MRSELPDKFQEVFQLHYPIVLRKLIQLVGERSVAEDLAQEVFLRLYRSPPENLAVVGAWLHRVATRVAYDYIRQKTKQKRVEERQMSVGVADAVEPSSDLLVLRNQERETVARVLQQLSDRDRQVLLLRYSGYSYAEIAKIAGVNVDIVGTVLKRALARFKLQYKREEGSSDEREVHLEDRYSI